MSSYEQRVEPPQRDHQYLVVSVGRLVFRTGSARSTSSEESITDPRARRSTVHMDCFCFHTEILSLSSPPSVTSAHPGCSRAVPDDILQDPSERDRPGRGSVVGVLGPGQSDVQVGSGGPFNEPDGLVRWERPALS